MEDNAYGKMKQLLKWNDANLRKKMLTKEDSFGPRGEPGLPGIPGKDGIDGLPGRCVYIYVHFLSHYCEFAFGVRLWPQEHFVVAARWIDRLVSSFVLLLV